MTVTQAEREAAVRELELLDTIKFNKIHGWTLGLG